MAEEKEAPRTFYIPPNFKNGLNFMGMSLSWLKTIEGAVFGGVAAIITYFICAYFEADTVTMLSSVLIVFAIFGYAGFSGVNDQNFTEFIYTFFKYQKRRRKAFYNPRVKEESRPTVSDLQKENGDMLSRETFEKIYRKYLDNSQKKKQLEEESLDSQVFDDGTPLFFMDDEGMIDKPLEYMTSREKRRLDKKKKAEEKARIKKQRQEAKNKAKKKPVKKKSTAKPKKKGVVKNAK